MNCTHCHSTNTIKNGKYKGRQRYLCKDCDRSSIEPSDRPSGGQCIGDRPMTAAERKRKQRAKAKLENVTQAC